MSGFQGSSDSELEKKLKEMGTRTLLFAGVNADQVQCPFPFSVNLTHMEIVCVGNSDGGV
jgi:hypothetical protein